MGKKTQYNVIYSIIQQRALSVHQSLKAQWTIQGLELQNVVNSSTSETLRHTAGFIYTQYISMTIHSIYVCV